MKIIVVGGGPGGYVAALKAAIMGAETILIEKDRVGGTCLNRGCIPTKAFLQSVDCLEEVLDVDKFGINCSDIKIDYESILKRKNQLVMQLVGGVEFLLKKRGVKTIRGTGKIINGKVVEVTDNDGSVKTVEGDAVILATGSKPVVNKMFKYDGINVITSDEALALKKLPESIIILGGGVIGCEFGQFFKKMGCEVTIIELAERLIPMEDADASELLEKTFRKNGINIMTGIKVEGVETEDGKVSAYLSDGRCLSAEKLLVSIGRRSVTEGIGLESAGIETENGKIVVDERMQTNIDGCYAIGDIVNTPALAHVASREAIVAVENAMGRNSIAKYNSVPRCVYTKPEIACVGMTEEQVRSKNIAYKTGKFGFAGLGKAMVIDKTIGFVKVMTDESGKVIGAVMTGPHVTDMISELTVAVQLGLNIKQLEKVIHPHPTLSEAIMEAVHDVNDESVHSF